MHRRSRLLFLIFTILTLSALNGCGDDTTKKSRLPRQNRDNWFVNGQIANGGYEGGEVLALALDGMRYRSRIADDRSFGIELPGNASYALYFLEARDRRDAYGANGDIQAGVHPDYTSGREALLNFEESPDVGMRNTLRLPKVLFQNNISLGQVDIKNHQAFPTVNPALKLDFDNDGINDFADLDDQNDGLGDLDQQKSTERIRICHFNSEDRGKTMDVPLAELYNHLEDGDTLGPCVATRSSNDVDASSQEIEVLNNAPAEVVPQPQNPTPPAPPSQPGLGAVSPFPPHPRDLARKAREEALAKEDENAGDEDSADDENNNDENSDDNDNGDAQEDDDKAGKGKTGNGKKKGGKKGDVADEEGEQDKLKSKNKRLKPMSNEERRRARIRLRVN